MPKGKGKGMRSKKSVDKAQNARIKSLEKFVYKTIENKQVNYDNASLGGQSVSTGGFISSQFLALNVGPEDGNQRGDPARIGNTITLMSQEVRMTFIQGSPEEYNRMRVLLVESVDGNEALNLTDILKYGNYATSGPMVFNSPYTTKTDTNKRYKIHMDKTFELNGDAISATRVLKHKIKYRENKSPGKLVEYAGPTSLEANNHRLHVLAISDSSAATHPVIWFNVRSTYKDA